MRLMLALLASLALTACADMGPREAADNVRDPAFRAPDAGELIVLLPAQSIAPEVAEGEAFIVRHLHRLLTEAHYRVVILDKANYAQIWGEEVAAVGGVYDATTGQLRRGAYGQALSALARRIAADTKCKLVLSHGLVVRTAQLAGSTADWDGQRRRQSATGAYSADYRYDGTTSGLSVELTGVTAEGALAFNTFGGTSLPFRTNFISQKNELREDLFRSDEETGQGVRLALKPLLIK